MIHNLKGASWDSIFLSIVKFLTMAVSIAITKILSIGLSLEEYGTYSQTLITISICSTILLFGLADALNYYYNNQSKSISLKTKQGYVNTVFFIEIILGIIIAIGLLLGRQYIVTYFSNQTLKILLTIVAIKPMFENLIYFYQVLFISIGKAKIIAIRNLIISIIKVIIIYLSVIICQDIRLIFILLILLDVVQLIFFKMYFALDGFWVNPFKFSLTYIKPILTYGIPIGIFALVSSLNREVDKLIIGRMTDTETLAIYANCSKLLPLDIIVVSFATVLIPYIMKYVSLHDYDNVRILFSNYLKIGYYSVWILGGAILIVPEQAISFLYSSQYLSGKIIFILYILDSTLRFASIHLILTAYGKVKILMYYSIMALFTNIVLNIILYYWIGIEGPAVATLIVTFIYTVAILKKTLSILHYSWLNILDIRDITTFFISLIITGIIVHFFNELLLNYNVNKYFSMIITMVLFCISNLLIWQTKILSTIKTINNLRL